MKHSLHLLPAHPWRHSRRFACLALLSWLVTAVGCVPAPVQQPLSGGDTRARLWRIQPPSGFPSHIFATLHSNDPRVTALSGAVRDAFDASTRLVTELDLGPAGSRLAVRHISLEDGRTLSDLVGPRLYNQCRFILARRGVSESALARMKPWYVAALITHPPAPGGPALDRLLYQMARARGMEISWLETAAEQAAVYDRLPLAYQVNMVARAVGDRHRLAIDRKQLMAYYLAGDLEGMRRFADRRVGRETGPMTRSVVAELVQGRNRRMAGRLGPVLAAGGAFVAVGALHLPGNDGLLALLARRGYTVTPVH